MNRIKISLIFSIFVIGVSHTTFVVARSMGSISTIITTTSTNDNSISNIHDENSGPLVSDDEERSLASTPHLSQRVFLSTLRGGGAPQSVDHVVLLSVKPNTPKKAVQEMCRRLESMVGEVPGVQSVRVGESFVASWMDDRRRGYTHYIRVQLESRKALKVYQDHPYHKSIIVECIAPILERPPLAIDCDVAEKKGD